MYVFMKALCEQVPAFRPYTVVADKFIVGSHSSHITDDPLILYL